MKPYLTAIFCLSIVVIFLTGQDEEKLAHDEYCKNTAIWKQDEANGVLETKRRGWPAYKEGVECD